MERNRKMYRINTIPGEVAKTKGHVSYPEDFPHLQPGEEFTAWRSGEDWEIETILNAEALAERLRLFFGGSMGLELSENLKK